MSALVTAAQATVYIWVAVAALTVIGLWLCAAGASYDPYRDGSRLDEWDEQGGPRRG